METNQTHQKRAALFKSLPISDWHQIISFEKIIRNYIKMIEILNKSK